MIVRDPTIKEFHEIAVITMKDLGRGESYAIALSLELKADLLLIKYKKARIIAESKGLTTKWSTEIL